jgi:uncharacterized protein (DUF169 family)
MVDLSKTNEALNLYIRPQSFPVAVRMVSSVAEIPKKARHPLRDLGIPMPACQGVALARRYGWIMAMGKDDMACPTGAVALGLVPPKSKFMDGSVAVPNWIEDKEVRRKVREGLPKFEYGKYAYLVCASLDRADFEPQSIIVYGNPAQIMRLVQGATSEKGELVTSASSGGGACAGYITKAILTDQCQLVLPGAGDRIFALTQDHEMCFAMPLSQIETVLRGLEITHKAGMRYPIPSFLRFKADLPPIYGEVMDYLKQGGEG